MNPLCGKEGVTDNRSEAKIVEAEKSQDNENEEENNDSQPTDNKDLIVKPKRRHPLLKYAYEDDQWSPLNLDGKRIYDGEFLHELRNDPKSNIKPDNLADVSVILMYNNRFVKTAKPTKSAKTVATTPKPTKSKTTNLAVDENSLPNKKDSSLRPTEDGSKLSELKSINETEEDSTLKDLFGQLEEILKILMPENLDVIVTQFKALDIESQEKLQGLVDLIYNQAVTKQNCVADYARMCKELATLKVKTAEGEKSDIDFRKLMITRCVTEFEDKEHQISKLIERNFIEKQTSKAFYSQMRRLVGLSFRVIRFMGELFKQGMFTTFIMSKCMHYLLTLDNYLGIKCLCELLRSIGKDLESKDQNLDKYFNQFTNIVECDEPNGVKVMLQDIIELRNNKWIPKTDNSDTKTLDPIQKEAETETLDEREPVVEEASIGLPKIQSEETLEFVDNPNPRNLFVPVHNLQSGDRNVFQLSKNVSLDPPKTVKPDKVAMPKEKVSSQPDKPSISPFSKSTTTGAIKSDTPDNEPTSSASSSISSRPSSTVSKKRLAKKSAGILDVYLSDSNVDARLQTAACELSENFDKSTFPNFVRDALSKVVNKSVVARKDVSLLMTHLISKNILPSNLYLSSLGEVLDASGDVVIDVSKIWISLAELMWYPLTQGVHPFSELKTTMAPLKLKGFAGTLMGELMIVLIKEMGPEWVKDKWNQSGLEWSDFLQENESLNGFIKKYKLEFILGDSSSDFDSSISQPSMEEIHKRLLSLMSNEKENPFNNICSWITKNVGERASEPDFIRVLMTAILEVSIESYLGTWRFRVERYQNLQGLIPRYIDSSMNLLELQCLLAVQQYLQQLESPTRLLLQILEKQIYESILSFDVFHAWESKRNTEPLTNKSIAMLAAKSFFDSLKESNQNPSSNKT